MIRFGLCCLFHAQPIRFRATTAKALGRFDRAAQLRVLSELALANADSLLDALRYCAAHNIGAFRVLSPFLPRYTHPDVSYTIDDLPAAADIYAALARVKSFRREHDIRLSFHPDQFIVLASPRPQVVENARAELEYQGMLAELLGAEVITLHVGGVYGDKSQALARFRENFFTLTDRVQSRLCLENDDKSYTVADLLPVSAALGIPLVYDVHHHRVKPDAMSVVEATEAAAATWRRLGREPWFHLSSPKNGWQDGDPKPHADYIDPADFPDCWRRMDVTVDIEAKAKEVAIARLQDDLHRGEKD